MLWIGAALALPVLLTALIFVAGEYYTAVTYLPGWAIIPPKGNQTLQLANVEFSTPRGVWRSKRITVTTMALRRGWTGISNKRFFRVGNWVVSQR